MDDEPEQDADCQQRTEAAQPKGGKVISAVVFRVQIVLASFSHLYELFVELA